MLRYNPDWQFPVNEIDDGFRQEYRAWLLLHTGYLVWAASASSSGDCYTQWDSTTDEPIDLQPCGTTYGWSATREHEPERQVGNWTPFSDPDQIARLKASPPFPTMLTWLEQVGLSAILQCQ